MSRSIRNFGMADLGRDKVSSGAGGAQDTLEDNDSIGDGCGRWEGYGEEV